MRIPLLLLVSLALQDPERELTGAEQTEHFVIKFRPGSRAASAVDRIAVMAEREFTAITKALDVKPLGGLELHLYDDIPELVAITKTRGNAGFSAGNRSHLPYDNDQTRFHEMVHLIAHRLPRVGGEPRNLFFAEGLANALLEFVHGVHVHAVASFETKRAVLPPLASMTGAADFYDWMVKRPCPNAYDIAGSYFRHLIDTYGVAKVKAYYTGAPAKEAFGAGEEEIEKAWRAFLLKYTYRPEVGMLLRRRRGEDVKFAAMELDPDKRLPPEIVGKPEEWKTVTLAGDPPAGWKRSVGGLEGTSDSLNWSILPLPGGPFRNAVVRARIQPGGKCMGVQLQLGGGCQAMITQAGTFIWKDGVAAQDRSETLSGRREVDLVFERRGREVTIWIDGFKIVSGPAGDDPAPVGLGVAEGSARFENVRVRELK